MNPSSPEDYVRYRIQRAKESIDEIEILIANKLWNTAVSRMYYACFYAVGALLVKNGITTSSHAGTRLKFGQIFILTGKVSKELGKHYSELFEKRQKSDYDDFYDVDQETVLRLHQPTIDFVSEVSKLVK